MSFFDVTPEDVRRAEQQYGRDENGNIRFPEPGSFFGGITGLRNQRIAELDRLNRQGDLDDGLFRFPVGPGNKDFARHTLAAIARDDFERFESAFLPLLRESADSIGNAALRGEQMGKAADFAESGLRRSADTFGRDLAERGIDLTPEQQASYDRKMDLDIGLARVDAANRTKRRIQDRDFELAAGGQGLRSRFDENGGLSG